MYIRKSVHPKGQKACPVHPSLDVSHRAELIDGVIVGVAVNIRNLDTSDAGYCRHALQIDDGYLRKLLNLNIL